MKKDGDWCDTCHRMVGVACSCEMSFVEKARTVTIHNNALPTRGRKNYYDKQAVKAAFGEDAKEQMLEETEGAGPVYPHEIEKDPKLVDAHYVGTQYGPD